MSASLDIDAVKARMKAAWMAGDQGVFAKYYERGLWKSLRVGRLPGQSHARRCLWRRPSCHSCGTLRYPCGRHRHGHKSD